MIDIYIIDNNHKVQQRFETMRNRTIRVDHDEMMALTNVERSKPSVILLNYELRRQRTAEYIALLHSASPDTRILFVTDRMNEEEIIDCLISGAQGYLQIDELDKYADKAINAVKQGEAWIPRRIAALMLDKLRAYTFTSTQSYH
ncbi:MAG: hypothetical protein Kow0065_16110 [Methylomicrobium sp.]